MRKFLLSLIGVLALGGAVSAYTVGQKPLPATGPGLVDGTWLNALAGGMNQVYKNGLTALGTNQGTALVLAAGIQLIEFDSVPSSTGAAMPQAMAGQCVVVFNHDAANTLTLYPAVRNNPTTGNQDVFETGSGTATSSTIAHGLSTRYCSAKDGFWN